MPNRITLSVLRRAQKTLRSSFLAYLDHAPPYVGSGDTAAGELMEELVARQAALTDRLSERIRHLGGEAATEEFPADFTATHDLSIDYALRRATREQIGVEKTLRGLADELTNPDALALLEETAYEVGMIGDQIQRAIARPVAAT